MQAILVAQAAPPALSPLTRRIPWPLLPVADRPLAVIALEMLVRAGCRQAFVYPGPYGGAIEAALGDGRRWGLQLEYLPSGGAEGPAQALRALRRRLVETCLLLPAGCLLDLDLAAALAAHAASESPATAVLHRAGEGIAPCPVRLSDGRVVALDAAPGTGELYSLTGAYLFEPGALQPVAAGAPFDLDGDPLRKLVAQGALAGYVEPGYWNPLQTVAAYQQAHIDWLQAAEARAGSGAAPRIRRARVEGRRVAPGIWVGPYALIHPAARLTPPVCLGQGCQIGRDVELGPNVVVGPGALIDDEATVRDSIVLAGTYVGRLVNLEHRIACRSELIDVQTGQSVRVMDSFLLADVSPGTATEALAQAVQRATAGLLLLMALPLMAVLALLLLLTVGRPVLCGSPRVHRQPDGEERSFSLLSLRTRRADGRRTWLGGWLERGQWRWLPSLWNALRGDVRLVGVKPLSPVEAAQVTEEWQEQRYQCRPGLTGLWYVQPAGAGDLVQVLVADAYYVATRTWHGDLALLVQTPLAWWRQVRRARA